MLAKIAPRMEVTTTTLRFVRFRFVTTARILRIGSCNAASYRMMSTTRKEVEGFASHNEQTVGDCNRPSHRFSSLKTHATPQKTNFLRNRIFAIFGLTTTLRNQKFMIFRSNQYWN